MRRRNRQNKYKNRLPPEIEEMMGDANLAFMSKEYPKAIKVKIQSLCVRINILSRFSQKLSVCAQDMRIRSSLFYTFVSLSDVKPVTIHWGLYMKIQGNI